MDHLKSYMRNRVGRHTTDDRINNLQAMIVALHIFRSTSASSPPFAEAVDKPLPLYWTVHWTDSWVCYFQTADPALHVHPHMNICSAQIIYIAVFEILSGPV